MQPKSVPPVPAPLVEAPEASVSAAAPPRDTAPPVSAPTPGVVAMIEPPSAAAVEQLQAPPVAKPKSALPAPTGPATLDGNVMPGQIRITRSRPSQPIIPARVQEAYDAYQRGDYNRAETLYRMALARHPHNRDALLGIAALNWRRGDRMAAAATYAKLLEADPQDSVARSALLTLRKDPSAVSDESSVKLMLQRDTNSPQLRFVLGNVFARQERWSEAQQSYFEAFKRDRTNPDFAYNLAVSLDNLGQQRVALEYYRKAMDLAAKRTARFVAADAQARIQVLAAAGGTTP